MAVVRVKVSERIFTSGQKRGMIYPLMEIVVGIGGEVRRRTTGIDWGHRP